MCKSWTVISPEIMPLTVARPGAVILPTKVTPSPMIKLLDDGVASAISYLWVNKIEIFHA
jgi:hypothetical protein